MGVLKGRNNSGAWVNASVVYGYDGSGVKTYAKQASIRKSDNSGWERAWTDCRKYDEAGGRDWSGPSTTTATVSCGGCYCNSNNRTDTTSTWTKTGCPNDVRVSTGACSGCGTQSQGAGTYTTTDGVTATYRWESDWLGMASYLVPTTCAYPCGGCNACGGSYYIGYSITRDCSTGAYTRSAGTCFKYIASC